MSRKDFQMIATIVANICNEDTRKSVAMDFAHGLQATNPRFDVARFVKACGC